MFRDNEKTHQLESLVDLGKHEEALDLVNKNHLDIYFGPTGATWLVDKCQGNENAPNWLEFFVRLLQASQTDRSDSTKKITILIQAIIRKLIRESNSALILKIIPYYSPSQIDELLLMLVKKQSNDFAMTLLLGIEDVKLQALIYKKLIQLSLDKSEANLLQRLQKESKGQLDFTKSLKELALSEKNNKKLIQLLALDQEKADFVSERMAQFCYEFGGIRYEGGLLTLAQVRARKKYNYNPTLLNVRDDLEGPQALLEFENYLKLLQRAPRPLKTRFVIAASHWISGEIEIGTDGVAKVLFIDSLGSSNGAIAFYTTEAVIKKFSAVFERHEIFYSQTERQHSPSGCSVYALDDSAHLPTLRLEEQYSKTGLLGYMSNASNRPSAKKLTLTNSKQETIIVQACELPISLMRTMQSCTLTEKTTGEIAKRTETEQALTINKKGEAALVSATKFFKENEQGKKQNTRLAYKLDKMAEYNYQFLIEHDLGTIKTNMSFHTLTGFKKRINFITQKMARIDKVLSDLKEKISSTQSDKAKAGGEILLNILTNAREVYCESLYTNSGLDEHSPSTSSATNLFKTTCIKAIQDAESSLEQDLDLRSWMTNSLRKLIIFIAPSGLSDYCCNHFFSLRQTQAMKAAQNAEHFFEQPDRWTSQIVDGP